MICTFIGGPADGARLEVGEGPGYFLAVPEGGGPGFSYERVRMRLPGGYTEYAYVAPDVDRSELLGALLYNYMPGFRTGE